MRTRASPRWSAGGCTTSWPAAVGHLSRVARPAVRRRRAPGHGGRARRRHLVQSAIRAVVRSEHLPRSGRHRHPQPRRQRGQGARGTAQRAGLGARGRQPDEGRVPGHALARAAHAPELSDGMDPVLRAGATTPDRAIGAIERNAASLKQLVDDLLDTPASSAASCISMHASRTLRVSSARPST